jgi:DNA-binding response OmpR family regulator
MNNASGIVLVVDDERKIRELVRLYLEREGYQVFETGSGAGAVEMAQRVRPDLIVLDLGLPDMSGQEVLRSVRRACDVPVVMLTARATEGDRVAGLKLGADDYVTKPFSPGELVARVQAVLRRSRGLRNDTTVTYLSGRLGVDKERREVTLDDLAVELTRTEFDLLVALASRPGRVWSRYELVNRVQGYDYDGYERSVDAHVKNLRRKLGDDPRRPVFVLTVPGVGYKFGSTADG